jgi:ribosomal protein S12 methylthiotransferase accessory factor
VDEPIKVTFPGGVRVDASFKGFTFKTDQPAYAGGTGTQPSPFDLFLASLATCAGYYVVSFFEERNIPSDGLEITMRTERDPATRRIGLVAIDISLPQGFPVKYRTAAVKAADQCTVKKLILNPPAFEITAAVRS